MSDPARHPIRGATPDLILHDELPIITSEEVPAGRVFVAHPSRPNAWSYIGTAAIAGLSHVTAAAAAEEERRAVEEADDPVELLERYGAGLSAAMARIDLATLVEAITTLGFALLEVDRPDPDPLPGWLGDDEAEGKTIDELIDNIDEVLEAHRRER